MTSAPVRCLALLTITLLTVTLFTACVTTSSGPTTPNVSIYDPGAVDQQLSDLQVQAIGILQQIGTQNQLFATDLGKLPELQELTPERVDALGRFARLYRDKQKEFDAAFEDMYKVGKPEVRRYCTPLQALFWLVEDNEIESVMAVMKDYSLNRLLKYSWKSETDLEDLWMRKEASKLIGSCTDPEVQKTIDQMDRQNEYFHWSLIGFSELEPQAFSYKPKPFEEEMKSPSLEIIRKNMDRWEDFNEVTSRLNAAELVHRFVDNWFKYQRGRNKSPYESFRSKKVQCISSAEFGKYCLKKAGYETFIASADWSGPVCCSDHTGSGIVQNGKYLLVVDFGESGNRYSGQWLNQKQLGDTLNRARGSYEFRWGHKSIL
nr:hypothetical protein [uncultured bacterium]